MTKKQLKKFYISLISNPDAKWTKEEYNDWTLLHCRIGNIRIESYRDWKLTFSYINDRGITESSETVTLKEIGISKLRMAFPYFGLAYRIMRRIKRENIISYNPLNTVGNIISKDKAINRENKINQILK